MSVGDGLSIGSMGMLATSGGGGASIPVAAPGLVFTSRTTTTVTFAHTVPGTLTNYSLSRLFVGVTAATPTSTATSSATESVTITGLSAGTRYGLFAVAESSGGAQLASSELLLFDTLPSSGSSTSSGIKAAIKVILDGVAGITSSTVHDRKRQPIGQDTATMQSLFEVGGVVDTWEIEEESLSTAWGAVNVAWHSIPNSYVVTTWRQWNDATDSMGDHRATIESAIDAINADITIGGTVTRHETVQVRSHGGFEMKGGRLCSFVELQIDCYATRKP